MNNTSLEKPDSGREPKKKLRFTFRKHERLTHRRIIERLFQEGKAYKDYPILLLVLPCALENPTQITINVSKRTFKRAPDRNRVKRLIREAWRLQKHLVNAAIVTTDIQLALAYLYVGKELPETTEINAKISALNQRLILDIPKLMSSNLPD